jgi:hypothetical protein
MRTEFTGGGFLMRTLLLLATAATLAWTASDAQAQSRTDRRVVVVQPHQAEEDGDVYVSGDDRVLTEGDYRGRGRWVEGEWTPDRRRFEGVYEVDEDTGPPPRHARHGNRHGADYDAPPQGYQGGRYPDEEMMRRCRGDNGLGGAAIGGVVGGVLGNRVGGRGNRRVGTAVGAVTGAAVGAAVDRAEDRRACAAWARDYEARSRYDRGYDGYEGGYDDGYGYGGGTQTIVIPGQPIIIEETETIYETVTVAPPRQRVRHRVAPRRTAHRPRPRPRCTCR